MKARLNTEQSSPEELERLQKTIAGLEARIQELQNQAPGIPAAGTTGTAATAGAAAPQSTLPAEFTTQVASVGPMNSFVVLAFGQNDGAQVGQRFVIVRDGQEIAQAQVSEVREGHAIAQIAPASIKSALRAGDSAAVAPRS